MNSNVPEGLNIRQPSVNNFTHNQVPLECQLASYFYELPEELIAQHPSSQRDTARLMVLDRRSGRIVHDIFSNLSQYLPTDTVFVVNNSKVIPARLLGKKQATGKEVEVFLLKALEDGFSFEALLKPLKKIQENDILDFGFGVTAQLINREKRIVRFNQANLIARLKEIGHIPLPPYIKREDQPSDHEDYQTVYAKQGGSVASPTAGLHFTHELIAKLQDRGGEFLELTLHINYGTFKPVENADIRQHPMHTEYYHMPQEVEQRLKQVKGQRKIVAVGTTSSRVLESFARNKVLEGSTDIFIYPGFKFQSMDALITNFHLPHSTLLMLVSAFGGFDLVKRAYQEAIKERYRFYSYGDAMLIV